jgi:hypothetical protein
LNLATSKRIKIAIFGWKLKGEPNKICLFYYTDTPVYNGYPWDPKKAAVVPKLRHGWPLFTVYYYKILESWA